MGVGARQAAAAIGFGDTKALSAEAEEKKRIDEPLMKTAGGKVGSYGFDIGTSLLPQSLAGKALKGAQFLPAVATGALGSVLTPEKNYSLGGQAVSGAIGGAVGDIAGKGLGYALNPRVGASKIRRDDLAELPGMPRLLAENLTDDKTVKTLTNTMSQMGPVGWGVNKSRAANLGQMTEDITGAAGNPTKTLTATEGRQMMDALTDTIEGFKQGPRVKLDAFPTNLAPALAEVGEVAAIAGGSTNITRRAMGATQGTPGNVAPFTRPLQGLPYPNYPQIPKSLTAKEALAIRSRASDAFHGTDDWVKKEQYMLLRDEMDKAIVKSRGKQGGQDYLDWKQQYDAMKHIEKAGISKEGNVLPEDFAATLTKNRQIAPRRWSGNGGGVAGRSAKSQRTALLGGTGAHRQLAVPRARRRRAGRWITRCGGGSRHDDAGSQAPRHAGRRALSYGDSNLESCQGSAIRTAARVGPYA